MSKKLLLLSALLSAVVMFTPSCGGDSDECDDVDCGANGACFSGSCVCDDGYVQNADGQCSVLFNGNYTASENCTPGLYTVNMTLVGSKITVKNFWGEFVNGVVMDVNGNNITIARQEPDNDDFFVQGSGTWTLNAQNQVTVSLNYTVSDESVSPTNQKTCIASYSK